MSQSSAPAGHRVSAEIMPPAPARRETWVPSLGWEALLEKG